MSGQSTSRVSSAVFKAVLQIVGAFVVAFTFLISSVVQTAFLLFGSFDRNPISMVVSGAILAGLLLYCGIRTLSLVSRFRKVVRVFDKSSGRILLQELSKATLCPVERLRTDLQHMIGRGYFAVPVQLDLYRDELIQGADIVIVPPDPDPVTGVVWRERATPSTFPVVAGVLVFLSYGLAFPLNNLFNIACAIIVAGGVLVLSRKHAVPMRKLVEGKVKPAKQKPAAPLATGDKEVDEALTTARKHLDEMARLGRSSNNLKLENTVQQMENTGREILSHVAENPDKLRQIRQFLNYYLPTTVKLLNTWDEFSQQKLRGENIEGSMQKIENMMQDILEAFRKELDNLYLDRAIDISADISVMQSMLQQEGIGSAVLELDFGGERSPGK